VLEQRSRQFVKEEITAECFILLNAKIEPDSGGTLSMAFVIYFPIDPF